MSQKRSTLDWVLEAVALLAVISILGTLAVHWEELPSRVPRHFGISGRPDRWGGKPGMLALPLASLGIYVLLSMASRHQTLLNVPMTIDRSLPDVQRQLRSMAITLKVILLLVFFYIEWANVETALGRAAGLGRWFLPASLVAVFLTLGFYIDKLRGQQKST